MNAKRLFLLGLFLSLLILGQWRWTDEAPGRLPAVASTVPRNDGAQLRGTSSMVSRAEPVRTRVPEQVPASTAIDERFVREGRFVGVRPSVPVDVPLKLRLDGRVDGQRMVHRAEVDVSSRDGRFVLELPGWAADCERFDLNIEFQALYYTSVDVHFDSAVQRSTAPLEIEVSPCSILTGKVVTAAANPVSAARVCAVRASPGESHCEVLASANTGSEGGYLLKVPVEGLVTVLALPMHAAWVSGNQLYLLRPSNEHGLQADMAIADSNTPVDGLLPAARTFSGLVGAHVQFAPLVLREPARITGHVLDASGSFLEGIDVEWSPRGGERFVSLFGRHVSLMPDGSASWNCSATTDEQGRFTVSATPGQPGLCRIVAEGQSAAPWTPDLPATAPTDLQIQVGRRVRIRLRRGKKRMPAHPVWVHRPRLGGAASLRLVTDDDGELTLWLPHEGLAPLWISSPEHSPLQLDARSADAEGLLEIDIDA